MANSNIGYIILEADISPKVVKLKNEKLNGKIVAEGILQTADEQNRNKRFYAKEELFPAMNHPRIKEILEAGYLRAEMGHPLSKELARQSIIDDTKTCARFIKLWTEGNDIWATFTATNNEYGNAFNLDLIEGCLPAWSLRALGNVTNTRRGAEVKNLRIITWDNVIYPSHPGAYTQRIVAENSVLNEAAGVSTDSIDVSGEASITPIQNESVFKFIEQSSENLKFVRECLDFAYSDIRINENGSKVILNTADGDTMVIKLENYIHNEIMNYASDILG